MKTEIERVYEVDEADHFRSREAGGARLELIEASLVIAAWALLIGLVHFGGRLW